MVLGLLWLSSGCARAPETESIPLDALLAALDTRAEKRRTEEGIELVVDGEVSVIVLLERVRAIELELRTDAPLNVIAGCYNGDATIRAGPPFRARDLQAGEASVAFDLAECIEWRAESLPVLFLRGTGRVLVRAARIAHAPADPEEFAALYDRATRWAPESLGGTTINFLTPPWWDARGSGVPARVALASGALGIAVLLAGRLRKRRADLGVALGVAALAATLGYDGWFARRILPSLALVPELDPEVRIREHLHNAPEVGALAALAREVLGPDEAVGVVGEREEYAGPRLLCFLLAPRPCVLVRPGAEEHAGLSGVGRMRLEELDALAVIESDAPLPAGFEPVARVNARSYVARRR